MSFDAFRWAIKQELPCIEKMVLIVLADFHNGKTGRCNPEKVTIAQVAGQGKRTTDGALDRLKERGLIKFKPTKGRLSNGYTLQLLHGSTLQEVHGSYGTNPAGDTPNPAASALNPAGTAPEPVITSKEPITPQKKFTDIDITLAEIIFQGIKKLNPNHKQPNMDTWADDIRKMREIDKRTPADIRKVFNWANADDFWQGNILSPGKLREKFDQLLIKMQGPANRSGPAERPPLGAFPE